MSISLEDQINQLKQAIASMEAQRPVLSDAAVDASLFSFQEKLAEFEGLTDPSKEVTFKTPLKQRKLV